MGRCAVTVYVDSGSTDNSVAMAQAMGSEVIQLASSAPFTAARARNSGFARLIQINSAADYVQFVDGDCELVDGWLEQAQRELDADPKVAVVCGRRRERFREASVYNRLCDIEWDTPIGEAKTCGGDAMVRVDAFQQVGGFTPDIIAGEEPELCLRLRRQGWRVLRVDSEMTLHVAAIRRFGQWWKRAVRSGHAYAEGFWRHGRGPERYGLRAICSSLFWGVVLPITAVAAAWPTGGLSLLLMLAYALQWLRIYRREERLGRSGADARAYALFVLVGKPAHALGIARFFVSRFLRRKSRIIEYK